MMAQSSYVPTEPLYRKERDEHVMGTKDRTDASETKQNRDVHIANKLP